MSYTITEFEKIYAHCFPAAMRLALSLLHVEDEARDVVQDTFLKLWESDNKVNNAEAYVIRSVRNACLNRINSLDVRERFVQGYTFDPPDSEQDLEHRHNEVKRAVETLLSPRERQVVEKVFAEGLSYKDTAASLCVSVALVNKCVVSALKTLRTRFNQHRQ